MAYATLKNERLRMPFGITWEKSFCLRIEFGLENILESGAECWLQSFQHCPSEYCTVQYSIDDYITVSGFSQHIRRYLPQGVAY